MNRSEWHNVLKGEADLWPGRKGASQEVPVGTDATRNTLIAKVDEVVQQMELVARTMQTLLVKTGGQHEIREADRGLKEGPGANQATRLDLGSGTGSDEPKLPQVDPSRYADRLAMGAA